MGLTNIGKLAAAGAIAQLGQTRYVGLLTALPTSGGGYTNQVEVAGGSYARVAVVAWNTISTPTTITLTHSGSIPFPTVTAPWNGVEGWGLFDAPTGGNLLAFGALKDVAGNNVSYDFVIGENVRFLNNDLKVAIFENESGD